MATATFTTFDRSAMPSNLLTVNEWLRLMRAAHSPLGWLSYARQYAARTGGAMILRADDSLIVFTRRDDGRVKRHTYRPGTWGWAA